MRQELIEKIEKMLEGDQKRRAIATEWLEKTIEKIDSASYEIFSTPVFEGDDIARIEKSMLYFRYEPHHGRDKTEKIGFYFDTDGYGVWGIDVTDLRGKLFWNCIQHIYEWVTNRLPELVAAAEEKSIETIEMINPVKKEEQNNE